MITQEFISELSTIDKLECLPENLPLEKDNGRWIFFDSFQEPVYTQRIIETLDCFLDRVLFDISQGGRCLTEQEVVNINLSTLKAKQSIRWKNGFQ